MTVSDAIGDEERHPDAHLLRNIKRDLSSLTALADQVTKRLLAWMVGEKIPQAVSGFIDKALDQLTTSGRQLVTQDVVEEFGLAADADGEDIGEDGTSASRPGPEPNE